MSDRREPEVDLALVFAVDCSGSVSNERLTMYIEGHAQAVTSPAFVAALANLPTGRAALAYVAWSNQDKQQYQVPWRVVDGPEAAAEWAQVLRAATPPGAGFTSISAAIAFCHAELLRTGVIDVVADGRNNDGPPLMAARDAAVAAGIIINGLPVLENDPHLDDYFAAEVVGGPACFVLPVRSEAGLLDGIRRKLLAEIA